MVVIGVDIGGTSTKVGYVDSKGNIINSFSYKPNRAISGEDYIKELSLKIKNFNEKYFKNEDIIGVGIGCAGAINQDSGVCNFSNNLNWHDLKIVEIMESIINKKCKITNDGNAAVLGEALFGVGKNYKNIVLLTIGTGVGGGLFLNDEFYAGNEGKGAELGHSILVSKGRKCNCGNRGCVERYCSTSALIYDTKKAMRKHKDSLLWKIVDNDISKVNGETVFIASKENDPTAIKVLNDYFYYLSDVVISYCNIFRPDGIIFCGGITNQGDYFLSRIKKEVENKNYGFKGTPSVKLLISNFKGEAGMIGAASLVLKDIIK